MAGELVRRVPGAELAPVVERAKEYIRGSRAESTQAAYRKDWEHFTAWCGSHGLTALPASVETVATYATACAEDCKPSTIQRRLAAISVAHKAAGHVSPSQSEAVRSTMKGIRREKGTAQHRVSPVRVEHLREVAPGLTDGLQDLRDRALLLVGYAGAFRRSELVALTVEDLQFSRDGVRILLRRSKTDQEGAGHVKGIGYGSRADTCPVRSLQAWLRAAGIQSGPIFRPINRHGQVGKSALTGKGVSLIVKRIAPRFGIDPESVSGHSLRAGFVTDQYAKGTQEAVIMQQTGHRSVDVLKRYRREANVFAFNYTAAVGL